MIQTDGQDGHPADWRHDRAGSTAAALSQRNDQHPTTQNQPRHLRSTIARLYCPSQVPVAYPGFHCKWCNFNYILAGLSL